MTSETQFEHIGGHPLIDFVNTKIVREGRPFEQLPSFVDLMNWLIDVGLVETDAAEFSAPDEDRLLAQVRAFRGEMRQMLATIVTDNTVRVETVQIINDQLLYWQGQPQLKKIDGKFIHQMVYRLAQPAHLLGLLAYTAAQFVAQVDFRYVKHCNNPECVRYFLDTSRNHSRRWCSMEGCGNRLKARAHYARKSQS